jgi:hypothetical protein
MDFGLILAFAEWSFVFLFFAIMIHRTEDFSID